ncbi:amidase family protein [Intrasporangium sp.]|uniref:amidase family protein n=1 Tax=Intrasporangium sp. TaxID=1925024 RepID=UPI003221624E
MLVCECLGGVVVEAVMPLEEGHLDGSTGVPHVDLAAGSGVRAGLVSPSSPAGHWRELFDGLDAVLAPTLCATAVRADDPVVRWPDGTEEPAIDVYVKASAPGNLTGLPALSVPCGFDSQGLPIGLQVYGRPFDEATVLRVGAAFEAATDFANRMPTGLG